MVKIGVAGAYGAFGLKHLDALANIPNAEVTAVFGPNKDKIEALAAERGIATACASYDEFLAADTDAVILSTPTQMHCEQSVKAMEAGKHTFSEIPMADSLADAEAMVAAQERTGVVGMVGHVRRFNPSHQYIRNKIDAGAFNIQQMDAQTYFFRRSNLNAKGEPRSWTDHLLWHHACHTIDLFMYQTGEIPSEVFGMQGPAHPELGIAMDMTIGLKTPTGKLCTLSLSFNNDGPLGSFFRYIGDTGTYIARYDDLVDGREQPIDLSDVAVSNNGIELIDREFIAAIEEGREPNSSFQQGLAAMQVMQKLEDQMGVMKV
ncbi:Gfo/Idh/MocA family oxidoreductase [Alphaproteobacteria bacterium]|jgi:2-hydroxy-4-carboxymuconate semialdehyde hemiacetal dehydrogenase|nr:Gfo/Idh/MocA family oxidoreductase [Alphaproteobacteria bacterium]MDA8604122.1 Gfo/Idh/MocA family oxidoreductase [Alphaproteobacteria bacterium]